MEVSAPQRQRPSTTQDWSEEMAIQIATACRMAWEWVGQQGHFPPGIQLEIRDIVDGIDAWECRVIYPVLMPGDRREVYRLVTMFVGEPGVEVGQDRTDHVLNVVLPGLTYEPEETRECTIEVFARYRPINKRNPPARVEDAEFWLENHLRPKEEKLADQLENWTEEDFDTDDEYWSWRERAANAFSRTRNEISGTFAWISSAKEAAGATPPTLAPLKKVKKKKSKPAEQTLEAPPSPQALGKIAEFARLVAEKEASFRNRYQPMYTDDLAPASARDAFERWRVLRRLRDDMESCRLELLAIVEKSTSKSQRKSVMRPIYSLEKELNQEVIIVNRFLQVTGATPEVLFLLAVIDRVVSQGFELTAAEYRYVEHLAQKYSGQT